MLSAICTSHKNVKKILPKNNKTKLMSLGRTWTFVPNFTFWKLFIAFRPNLEQEKLKSRILTTRPNPKADSLLWGFIRGPAPSGISFHSASCVPPVCWCDFRVATPVADTLILNCQQVSVGLLFVENLSSLLSIIKAENTQRKTN